MKKDSSAKVFLRKLSVKTTRVGEEEEGKSGVLEVEEDNFSEGNIRI